MELNFDTDRFRHRVHWAKKEWRIEMHLESTCDQHIWIPDAQLGVEFEASETNHTENSYKFTQDRIGALLEDAVFAVERMWTDPLQSYALTLAGARQMVFNWSVGQ